MQHDERHDLTPESETAATAAIDTAIDTATDPDPLSLRKTILYDTREQLATAIATACRYGITLDELDEMWRSIIGPHRARQNGGGRRST